MHTLQHTLLTSVALSILSFHTHMCAVDSPKNNPARSREIAALKETPERTLSQSQHMDRLHARSTQRVDTIKQKYDAQKEEKRKERWLVARKEEQKRTSLQRAQVIERDHLLRKEQYDAQKHHKQTPTAHNDSNRWPSLRGIFGFAGK